MLFPPTAPYLRGYYKRICFCTIGEFLIVYWHKHSTQRNCENTENSIALYLTVMSKAEQKEDGGLHSIEYISHVTCTENGDNRKQTK